MWVKSKTLSNETNETRTWTGFFGLHHDTHERYNCVGELISFGLGVYIEGCNCEGELISFGLGLHHDIH